MNARIPLLGGLLVLQLLVAGLFVLLDGREDEGGLLLELEPAAVTGLRIAGGAEADAEPIELSRTGDDWTFADGVKADRSKIDSVLEKLADAQGAWPVATSGSSQERFEVTAEKHQRNLTLSGADGVLAELYLGTSPGYRRVHARRVDAEEVFSIDFANHEVPTTKDDWLDNGQLASAGVTRVALEGGWTLEKSEEGWRVDGAAADAGAAQKLIDRLEGLRVTGFHEGDEGALEAPRVLTVEDAQGTLALTLRHDAADDAYVIESDRVSGRFELPSYVAEQILVDAQTFAPPAETADTAGTAESAENAGAGVTSPADAGEAP